MAEREENQGRNGFTGIQAENSWFGGTTYRIPAKAEPSFWGEWAHTGIVIGSLAMITMSLMSGAGAMSSIWSPGLDFGSGMLAKGAAGFLNNIVNYVPMFAGMAGGAVVNKYMMQKELEEGKEISPPSFFNRGLLQGALHGLGLFALASFALGFVVTGGIGGLIGHGVLFKAALGVAGLVGAMRGASRQKDEDERIYKFVEERYAVETGQVLPERGKGISQYIAPAAGVATAVAAGIPGVDPTGLHGIFSDAAVHTLGTHSAAQMKSDFSYLGDAHPANKAQRTGYSHVEAERSRRGGVSFPEEQQAAPENLGRFASRLSDDRLAQAIADMQGETR